MNNTSLLTSLIPLIIIGCILLVLKALLGGKKKPSGFPYESRLQLLTPAELSFFGILRQALGMDHLIMSKVRLADVVTVERGLDNSARQKAINRIQSKHLDFVVCKPEDTTILFAVELDDKSHERDNRRARDVFVDEVLKTAGIRLHRFTAKRGYSIQDVRAVLLGTEVLPQQNVSQAASMEQPDATVEAVPMCPKCGTQMVRRAAKSGNNAGKEFWGCPDYPKCRGVVGL